MSDVSGTQVPGRLPPDLELLNDFINGYGDEWHDMTIGDIAVAALDCLREWPVEQRMEAMGMKPTGRTFCTYHSQTGLGICHNPLDCDLVPTFRAGPRSSTGRTDEALARDAAPDSGKRTDGDGPLAEVEQPGWEASGPAGALTLCPKCLGQKVQARPPWVPHDVDTWVSSDTASYPCVLCDGTGILERPVVPDRGTS